MSSKNFIFLLWTTKNIKITNHCIKLRCNKTDIPLEGDLPPATVAREKQWWSPSFESFKTAGAPVCDYTPFFPGKKDKNGDETLGMDAHQTWPERKEYANI